jgi:hypothetical protein
MMLVAGRQIIGHVEHSYQMSYHLQVTSNDGKCFEVEK